MISVKFNSAIRAWIEAAPEDRDYALGALYVLQLDHNTARYDTIIRNPAAHATHIEDTLRRALARREDPVTPEKAKSLAAEADRIMTPSAEAALIKGGKRPDHDSLPADIRKLYEDNLELRHKMQQYHLQVRTLLASGTQCSREDIKDLVDLIRAADIKYHNNWNRYDNFS